MQTQIAVATAEAESVSRDAKTVFELNKADFTGLHEKTRVLAEAAEVDIEKAKSATASLREEVTVWSLSYGEQVRQLVIKETNSGRGEHGDGVTTTGRKLDKKEVNVWKS